ncbi:Plasma membrane calcium-transporting ATPase 2 [Sarcoptes scabiei]|uniref:Plasma membrane calcium-transporting ATPase 2 n=1 Tax=Sarcoptes scabiei TaxID=52283 RepID=A0A834R5W2_SARSC|nr:Plasma membrane calcium-transporting ATPase 2 [Sarcoptes scabiei]
MVSDFSWKKITKINNLELNEENRYGFIESLAILISIIIIVLVTAFSEYSKEIKFRALQKRLEKENKINVLRNGNIYEIPISDLVVGDICIINYGNNRSYTTESDIIPADGILLECNELKIDESTMTGESDLVTKQLDRNIILYAGTNVMEGSGKMIVIAVGPNSQTGQIYALLKASSKRKSVLQSKLTDIAVKIGYFGNGQISGLQSNNMTFHLQSSECISIAIITISMLIIRSCVVNFGSKKERLDYKHLKEFFDHIITGITILVVAVPEGLPLAVTLSLAYSVKQMIKDNNLVRHIDACETMGNATTICSDKTGTLTANRMTAVQCYICGVYYTSLSKRILHLNPFVTEILAQNIALNSANTSRIEYGNKTECALLGFLFKLQLDYAKFRQTFANENIHRVFQFNSTRKMMMTIIKLPNNKGFRLLAKGASEIILRKCAFIVGANGEILRLDQNEKSKIIAKVFKVMAQNGLRIICLAYLDYLFRGKKDNREERLDEESMPINCERIDQDFEPDWENQNSKMTCLAVIGIEDPVRKDVPFAIKKCHKAGITIRMVTGDNIDTARSIALKCGIISPTEIVNDGRTILDSKEFNRIIRDENGDIDQDNFDSIWPYLKVLARSTPTDKYNLVKHIIASRINPAREVVAVTGDGTNDAPALKMADVGFAMGIAGTEVAKEASDIILTDDNFSSIVKSVIWGRNVYDCITKFIQFQLTVNMVAVLICFISACLIQESPLRPVQMLWVNLIMDTLGSLALSTEKPSKTLLLRKPYGRNKSLISFNMFKIIALSSFYQLSILIFFLVWAPDLLDFDSGYQNGNKYSSNVHFTMLFNVFVLMTLFNQINSRKINGERNVFEGITTNKAFCAIFLSTFVIQSNRFDEKHAKRSKIVSN